MGFGYEEDVPPAPMIAAVVWLLREGVRRGWWRSAELAGGHRDVKATLGPGRFAQRLIPEINERATGGAARTEDPVSIVQLPRTPAPEQDVPRSEWPRTEEVVHLGYVGGWHGRVILRLAVGHPGGYLYRAHLDYPTGEGARVEHWVTPDAGFEVEGAYAQAEELVFEELLSIPVDQDLLCCCG